MVRFLPELISWLADFELRLSAGSSHQALHGLIADGSLEREQRMDGHAGL
jgi:hypothetical protein